MKQFLSYILVAMILSCSSIAMAARILHRDLFAEQNPELVIIWALLSLVYLFCLEWMNWRQNVKKMVRG